MDNNFTEKEIQVMKYLAKGFENRKIADKLKITIYTVKVHVTSIMQKLKVHNRSAAAYQILKNHIVKY